MFNVISDKTGSKDAYVDNLLNFENMFKQKIYMNIKIFIYKVS